MTYKAHTLHRGQNTPVPLYRRFKRTTAFMFSSLSFRKQSRPSTPAMNRLSILRPHVLQLEQKSPPSYQPLPGADQMN